MQTLQKAILCLVLLENLDRKHKTMFFLGGLSLPFDSNTTTVVKRFVSTAPISYVIRRLRGLNSSNFLLFSGELMKG